MTHPALDQLAAALDRARASSNSRRLQVNWVLRDLETALAAGDLPPGAADDAHVLLAPATLERFLQLADADAYRTRAVRNRNPSPWSAQVRRSVLRHLTREYTGTPVPLSPAPGAPPREDLPDLRQQQGLWTFVADAHLLVPPDSARRRELIRTAATVGVILDTAGRAGEVARLTLADLSDDRTVCTLTRFPQGGGAHAGETTAYRLRPNTTRALGRWLPLRADLTAHHEGTPVTALWVSVRAGGRQGPRTVAMPGLPLSARTVRVSYERVVAWLNSARASDPLWESMPETIERLRLASNPIEAPPGEPGAGR